MHATLLSFLACPRCRGELELRASSSTEDLISEGQLRCPGCSADYPIRGGIPRFVPDAAYARSFSEVKDGNVAPRDGPPFPSRQSFQDSMTPRPMPRRQASHALGGERFHGFAGLRTPPPLQRQNSLDSRGFPSVLGR